VCGCRGRLRLWTPSSSPWWSIDEKVEIAVGVVIHVRSRVIGPGSWLSCNRASNRSAQVLAEVRGSYVCKSPRDLTEGAAAAVGAFWIDGVRTTGEVVFS
jgi:hypothetical protein